MFERADSDRDPSRAVLALRRLWWVILLVAAVSAAGAYLLGREQPKQYSATASLLLRATQLDQALFGIQVFSATAPTDPTREPATNQSLLELPVLGTRVARQLHLSPSRVTGDVSVGSDAASDLVNVTAADQDPGVAAAVANAYVQQYIAFRQAADRSQLSQAESLIDTQLAALTPAQLQGPGAQNLQTRRNELQLLASLQTGNAEVVQAATRPTTPSGPHPARDGVIGLMLGLLVGCGLALVIERRDRRMRSMEEIERLYQVPILGTVPESSALRRSPMAETPRDQDAFRMIRAQLRYFSVDRDITTVLITSAANGEGKSLIALNLARAAGQTGAKRVLLLEADLRAPSLAAMAGLEKVAGLAELLSDFEDLHDGLRELIVTLEPVDPSQPGAGCSVLFAGATPPNPGELLESRRMLALVEILDTMYDLIIIDATPVGAISDTVPLVHLSDAVLVVTRLGRSRWDQANRLMKQLRTLGANTIGVVANSAQAHARGYGDGSRASRQSGLGRIGASLIDG
jgi:polysaccharide biosynthesis transport protein